MSCSIKQCVCYDFFHLDVLLLFFCYFLFLLLFEHTCPQCRAIAAHFKAIERMSVTLGTQCMASSMLHLVSLSWKITLSLHSLPSSLVFVNLYTFVHFTFPVTLKWTFLVSSVALDGHVNIVTLRERGRRSNKLFSNMQQGVVVVGAGGEEGEERKRKSREGKEIRRRKRRKKERKNKEKKKIVESVDSCVTRICATFCLDVFFDCFLYWECLEEGWVAWMHFVYKCIFIFMRSLNQTVNSLTYE